MSAALLEYVETTQLVNDLTSRTDQRTDGPPNLMPIKDPATVRTQASTATEIARRQVQAIAAAGLDPSYLQWNSRWGEQLAFDASRAPPRSRLCTVWSTSGSPSCRAGCSSP